MKTVNDKRTMKITFMPLDKDQSSPVMLENTDYVDNNEEMDIKTAVLYMMDLANAIACLTTKYQDVCKYLNMSKSQQNKFTESIFKDLKQVEDDNKDEQ